MKSNIIHLWLINDKLFFNVQLVYRDDIGITIGDNDKTVFYPWHQIKKIEYVKSN